MKTYLNYKTWKCPNEITQIKKDWVSGETPLQKAFNKLYKITGNPKDCILVSDMIDSLIYIDENMTRKKLEMELNTIVRTKRSGGKSGNISVKKGVIKIQDNEIEVVGK